MTPHSACPKRGLYLITPDYADTAQFLDSVLPWLGNDIAMLQYRNKLAANDQRHTQAQTLLTRCRELGIPLIINDDVVLAETLNANGVHLGEHDGDIAAARLRLGKHAIIGASCYNSLAKAETAAMAGADYLAFGAMFSSSTKPNARHAQLDIFSQARHLKMPMVAIGGISSDNAKRVLSAGADLIAVINAVFTAENPALEIEKFASQFINM
jgi:thiamine-phosphate pyrophosphorylase